MTRIVQNRSYLHNNFSRIVYCKYIANDFTIKNALKIRKEVIVSSQEWMSSLLVEFSDYIYNGNTLFMILRWKSVGNLLERHCQCSGINDRIMLLYANWFWNFADNDYSKIKSYPSLLFESYYWHQSAYVSGYRCFLPYGVQYFVSLGQRILFRPDYKVSGISIWKLIITASTFIFMNNLYSLIPLD